MLPVVKIIPLKVIFKEEIPSLYKNEIAEVNTVIPIISKLVVPLCKKQNYLI
jgi:hypothetical protein